MRIPKTTIFLLSLFVSVVFGKPPQPQKDHPSQPVATFEKLKPSELKGQSAIQLEREKRLLGLGLPGFGLLGLGIPSFGIPTINLGPLGVPDLGIPDLVGLNALSNFFAHKPTYRDYRRDYRDYSRNNRIYYYC